MLDRERFLSELAKRRTKSRVHTRHQLMGLLIAEALGDQAHKSLYIKMAKEGNADMLLSLAKDVSTRGNVENRGAYFMTTAHERGFIPFTHPEHGGTNIPTKRS